MDTTKKYILLFFFFVLKSWVML